MKDLCLGNGKPEPLPAGGDKSLGIIKTRQKDDQANVGSGLPNIFPRSHASSEAVRAKLRVLLKRILRNYGYPPDKQEKATQTMLEQAELCCNDWV